MQHLYAMLLCFKEKEKNGTDKNNTDKEQPIKKHQINAQHRDQETSGDKIKFKKTVIKPCN